MHVGYNIRDRKSSGLRLFNKNRLIVDIDGKSRAKWSLGVIASVDDREFRLAFKKYRNIIILYNLVFFKNWQVGQAWLREYERRSGAASHWRGQAAMEQGAAKRVSLHRMWQISGDWWLWQDEGHKRRAVHMWG